MGMLLLNGSTDFNPRELFASGEQGLWLDPSDFSTMWQDAAGDTPVTAASDPVALILDKSRSGPSMGSNQVTNGGFGADSDWTKGTGWAIGSGVATKTAGSASLLSQAQTMTAGRYYIVTYTITRTAGSITPQFAGGSTVSGTARSTSGTFTDIMTVVSGNNTLQLSADASFAGTVDNVSLKELSAGNHAYQTTSASRPTLQTTGGLWYLSFDGSDDSLVTNSVDFSATDEMTVIAGVRKLTDSSYPMIVESSVNWSANNGAFSLSGNLNNGYAWSSRGTGGATVLTTDYLAPVTTVLGLQSHIAGPSLELRANGSLVNTSSATQGLGNYGNWPIYIGRRGGSTLPYTGHIYQLIIRGKTTPTGKLLEAERFVGKKTGVSF